MGELRRLNLALYPKHFHIFFLSTCMNILPTWMYLYHIWAVGAWGGQRRTSDLLGTGVTDSCDPLYGCYELNRTQVIYKNTTSFSAAPFRLNVLEKVKKIVQDNNKRNNTNSTKRELWPDSNLSPGFYLCPFPAVDLKRQSHGRQHDNAIWYTKFPRILGFPEHLVFHTWLHTHKSSGCYQGNWQKVWGGKRCRWRFPFKMAVR